MAVLAIYKLDSEEHPVSKLQVGEHIFGRGALLKCDDRRVSRKHGVITITKESATITSTHQNPCFYQAANSAVITILPKDSPVNISDGDKFALLADQFWFRIELERPMNTEPGRDEAHAANGDRSPQMCENFVANNDETRIRSPSPQMSKPGSSKASDEAQDVNNESDDSIDFLQTPQKRPREDDAEISCKKAKPDDEMPSREVEENELQSILNDLKKKEAMSESEDEGDEDKKIEPTKLAKPATSTKEAVSASEGEDHDDIETKPTKPATPKKGQAMSKKKAEAMAVAQSAHDDELQAMLFSSDDDAEEAKKTKPVARVKPTVKAIVSVNKKNEGNSSANNTEPKDGENVNKDESEAGTSSKRQRRDRCWYGLSCYRKNSKHLSEYSHPGDSDFESDPNDDRPQCAFGSACYRRNKDHRQAYKHSQATQKPPGNKRKKDNTGTATKKRTTKKQYADESSEDDYDLDDPFMADSGSEYEADSGSDDDDDSDTDWSGTEEETKRLFKEAKRFTKGKKKDKDID